MQHTPYGYSIIDGKAVVDTEKAEILKRIISNYLSGMSFAGAAAEAGIKMNHCSVKRLIQNERYRGDSFYPAIITEETARLVEEERQKRERALGRQNMPKKDCSTASVTTEFRIPAVEKKYDDLLLQAEYAYGLIESGVD